MLFQLPHVIHVVGITSLEFAPPVYDFALTVRPRNGWRGVLDTTVCDKGCLIHTMYIA
jgi:hypothetical protein